MLRARGLGLKRLLLLGIRFTMQGTFYQEAGRSHGIHVVTPGEREQDEVDRIVFDELVIGVTRDESRGRLLDIVDAYPVDGVILGCTELPMLLRRGDGRLPMLDTVEIHVEAALDYSLSS